MKTINHMLCTKINTHETVI